MIRCLSFSIMEIDDIDAVTEEVHARMDGFEALTHTAGLVFYHPEFAFSGALSAVCEALPFDVIGMSTAATVTPDNLTFPQLSVFLITSDTVVIRAGRTDDVRGDLTDITQKAYDRTAEGITENPKLILALTPLTYENAGDAYPRAWNTILPEVPVFGSVTIDDTVQFRNASTCFNGEADNFQEVFMLFWGDFDPRFLIVSEHEDDVQTSFTGVITRANGHLLHEIDGIPAKKFFANTWMGDDVNRLFLASSITAYQRNRADYDGFPIQRGITSYTEDGTAVLTGEIDEGSPFVIKIHDEKVVMEQAQKRIDAINALPDIHGMLSFSCIINRTKLGTTPDKEFALYQSGLCPDMPYAVAYSGGEICPTSYVSGKAANNFNNFTLVTLIL